MIKRKKSIKKVRRTLRPVKSRKAGILRKAKLFSRVKKRKGFSVKKKLQKIKTKQKSKKVKKTVFKKSRKRIGVRLRKKGLKIKKGAKISLLKARIPRKRKKKVVRQSGGKLISKTLPKVKRNVREVAQKHSLLAESFKPKIKVIGIGGGGGSIVSEIGRSLEKATFVIADTDVRAFKKRQGIKYFLFGHELTHGLGTGLNVNLAKEAAQRENEKISQLLKGQDIVIFITCLGGGLGSGATQIFSDAAKNFGGITLGIFTLPFKFEGKSKHKIATKALKELRKSLHVSITIPNERIFKIIDENTPIVDAFSMVNKNLIESLESLIDLIQSPGLINIDFADLRAILQGRGNLAFLNTAESSGRDKTDKVILDVLHNPLYQDNFVPEKVLFNIEGGKNLSMFEVDKISKAIAEKNPKAKIIFGISKNPAYKNKIKTTLLMAGSVSPSESMAQKTELVSLPKKIKAKAPKPRKIKQASLVRSHQQTADAPEKNPLIENLIPVFGSPESQLEGVKRIGIAEKTQNSKKTIRRTALEIKEAEDLEKNKKSKQEEEWEIPAFLRFKKVK